MHGAGSIATRPRCWHRTTLRGPRSPCRSTCGPAKLRSSPPAACRASWIFGASAASSLFERAEASAAAVTNRCSTASARGRQHSRLRTGGRHCVQRADKPRHPVTRLTCGHITRPDPLQQQRRQAVIEVQQPRRRSAVPVLQGKRLMTGRRPRTGDLENGRAAIAAARSQHARQQPSTHGMLDVQVPPGRRAADHRGKLLQPRAAGGTEIARHEP